MNINNLISDFTKNISSMKLSNEEEEFITKSYNHVNKLKENSLFHVVKDAIVKDIQRDSRGRGLTLASIEKLFYKINADHEIKLDPELTQKIKKLFLEQYVAKRALPETVEVVETKQLLTYLLKEQPQTFGWSYDLVSFLDSLSGESQLQLATYLAKQSRESATSINFSRLNKIKNIPLESRLEIAKMIASHGESAVENLCNYQLRDLHLQDASFEQKMDLAAYLFHQCKDPNTLSKMYEGILQLQSQNPKEHYLKYLKALIQKFVLESKGLHIDLDPLTQKDVPPDEKLILAKKLAPLGYLADQYMADLIPEVFDAELAALVLKQKGEGYYAVLEHLASLPLKDAPMKERLEFAKLIFDHRRDMRNEPYLFKIIEALVSPKDTLENLFEFAYTIIEGDWFLHPDQRDLIVEAILKNIPKEGVPLSDIEDLIRKNNNTSSLYMTVYFHFVKCQASNKEIFGLVPIILDQGKVLTSFIAENLDKLDFQSVPLQVRIDTLMKILQLSPDSRVKIASNLHSILSDVSLQDRLSFAKTFIQSGDQGAMLVAQGSEFLKLNEAAVPERLELAFLLAKSGYYSAKILKENLEHFFLSLIPADETLRLAELLVEQGQAINRITPEALNVKALSIEQRFALATLMINDLGVNDFDKAWVADMPWENRLKFAQLAIKKSNDNHQFYSVRSWDLQDVPFSELYSYAELFMQHDSTARGFAVDFLALFGPNLKGTELITLLKLFSRQSTHLLKIALREQLTSPPLSAAACRQAIMEFLIDTPLDLQIIFDHPALQEIKPILNLLTMKTLDVQEEVNQTNHLPKDVQAAKVQLIQFLERKDEFKTLRHFYSEIDKIGNPMLQFKLMRWLAYTAGKYTDVHLAAVANAGKLDTSKNAQMLDEIYAHQSLPNRFVLVRELSHMTETFQPRVVSQEDGKLKEFNEYGKLSWILLARLKTLGVSNEQLEKINDVIDGKKKFKETKNFSVLLELLNEVILLPPLSTSEANLFCDRLEEILKLNTMEKTLQNLQSLTNILILLGRENFIKALSEKNISAFFFKEFEKHIPIGKIDEFARKWQNTFGKSRNPNAIFIYLRSLEKLPLEDREIAKKALGHYIQSVLNGDFPGIRYKTENQPHLEQVFANEEIMKHWLDKGKPVEVGNYTLSFSDDFMDLLLIGTEIQGSCMHIGEDPRNNKALISSLMHGGILPIVARQRGSTDGKMASRCFLRLGWDKDHKTAVLLQESIYSNVKEVALSKAMNQMAVDKAKQLGIPLIEKDKYRAAHGTPYDGTFSFLGSDYPFIYSDAAGGIVDGLKGFDIKDCYTV